MPTASILALLIAAAPASAQSGEAAVPEPIKIDLQLSVSPLAKGDAKIKPLKNGGGMGYMRAPDPSPLVAEKDANGRLKLYHGPKAQSKTKQPKEGEGRE